MHIRRSAASECIDFVDEDYYSTKASTGLPNFCKLLFAFTIELAHNGFQWKVDKRYFNLLGDDLG